MPAIPTEYVVMLTYAWFRNGDDVWIAPTNGDGSVDWDNMTEPEDTSRAGLLRRLPHQECFGLP